MDISKVDAMGCDFIMWKDAFAIYFSKVEGGKAVGEVAHIEIESEDRLGLLLREFPATSTIGMVFDNGEVGKIVANRLQ